MQKMRVNDIYKENGVQSSFINIGGNALTLGNKPEERLGLQDFKIPLK